MPDIFLSYNRNDQATARRFAEGFEREGFTVWWDQTLRSGEAYDKVTEKALEEARAVVVLWSKNSADSRWVRAEATQADRNGTLVPAMIEACKRPIMFELTHTADLIKWKGDPHDATWQAFVADVRQFVHKDAPVSQALRPVPGKPRKFSNLLIAVSAAAVLAGGILFWALNRAPGKTATAPATTAVAAPAPVTLAVLPFANPDGSEAGRVLAFGVAEAVTDQLTNLSELSVIAWSSASGVANATQSVRDIGKQLSVAYLLQGSVQRSGDVLRVTARLVEAATERSVWSLRLDRDQKDVFSIQDEIASQVTRALSVSVSAEGRERMRGQGTRNVEAYLAFLEGQDALATWRTREAGIAATHFNRAVGLDPQFARALVMLVRARMRDADHSSGPDQRDQVAKALKELPPLIDRALSIDPRLGEAYVERGDLRIYDDPMAAERDYRKAIELTPSNARAYQQLAALLYDDPSRRREVAEPLQRARTLDPLDPDLAVTWAVYLFYETGNAEEGESLLRQVLERNPQYLPALIRRGEMLLYGLGRTVDSIGVLEEALQQDPDSDYVRRLLVQAFIAVGDYEHARLLARQPGATQLNQMFLDLAEHHVDRAARVAYEAIDSGTLVGTDQWAAVEAVNLDARRTRNFPAGALALDEVLGIHWTSNDTPVLDRNRGLITDVLSYVGMLRVAGEVSRATTLLNAADQAMDLDEKERGSVNPWNTVGKARVAILKGNKPAALTGLERACRTSITCWYWLSADPLFEPLRGEPRFQALSANLERQRIEQRNALKSH